MPDCPAFGQSSTGIRRPSPILACSAISMQKNFIKVYVFSGLGEYRDDKRLLKLRQEIICIPYNKCDTVSFKKSFSMYQDF